MCWQTYGQCHDIRIKHHVYDAAKLIILELNASTSSFSSERQSVTKTGLITENKLHVYIYIIIYNIKHYSYFNLQLFWETDNKCLNS